MCSSKFRPIWFWTLYFLVLILGPIITLCFLPILIFRRCVAFLGQVFGPSSLGKMLTSSATSHGCFESRGTCILPFTLKGIPNLDHIKNELTNKVLNARAPNGTQLLYPELRQTVVSWGGYLFWKDIPNFQLPIRIMDISKPVDLNSPSGLQILRSLYGKKWKFGEEALWEIVIVPGLNEHFGLVFIVHHALGDASSVQRVINELSHPLIVVPKKSENNSQSPLRMVITLFRLPYDVALYLMIILLPQPTQRCSASKKTDCADLPNSKLALFCTPLHLPNLKKTARVHGVSLNSLLMASIEGSIHKQWEGSNILYFPTPATGTTIKLRSEGGSGYVELFSQNGHLERLRHMENQLQNFKLSTFPFFSRATASLVGCLPPFLLRKMIHGAAGSLTFVFSTFVVSRHSFSILGYPVIQIGSAGSAHAGTRVVAIFAFSSVDSMFFTVMGDQMVVTEDKGKAFLQCVLNEFESLKESEPRDHIRLNMCTK